MVGVLLHCGAAPDTRPDMYVLLGMSLRTTNNIHTVQRGAAARPRPVTPIRVSQPGLGYIAFIVLLVAAVAAGCPGRLFRHLEGYWGHHHTIRIMYQ